jgi:hypothetical protein
MVAVLVILAFNRWPRWRGIVFLPPAGLGGMASQCLDGEHACTDDE